MPRLLIGLLILFATAQPAAADIIPRNHHFVSRSVIIEPWPDQPDVIILGRIDGPMIGESGKVFLIQPNKRLYKGYKLNRLTLFAVKKSLLNGRDPLKLDLTDRSLVRPTNFKLDPGGTYLPNYNPVASQRFIFRIAGWRRGVLILDMTHRMTRYSGGRPEKVEVFPPTDPASLD